MDAVVVTANSAPDLAQLLLCDRQRAAFDRLVVVDNASTDNSRELADAAGAQVIARPARHGYGTAVNLGARATTGPLFAVVNPDIRLLEASAPERLARVFEDPRVAIAAPALELPDGRTQDSAREVPTPLDLVLRRRFLPGRGAVTRPGPVPWVVGAFLLVRRSAFEMVGGFDAGYALYFEDVDLCVRLRRAGWSVVYEPQVRVKHEHRAASRRTLLGRATRTHVRSATRFYRRNPRHLMVRGPAPPRRQAAEAR